MCLRAKIIPQLNNIKVGLQGSELHSCVSMMSCISYRQTKKSTWDVGRSMRYNQDAQRSEGNSNFFCTLKFTVIILKFK